MCLWFFALGLSAREFFGTLCLDLYWLVKRQIRLMFISPEDLKICQNLITLTRMQTESQWERICKSQNFKNESHFGQEVIK